MQLIRPEPSKSGGKALGGCGTDVPAGGVLFRERVLQKGPLCGRGHRHDGRFGGGTEHRLHIGGGDGPPGIIGRGNP